MPQHYNSELVGNLSAHVPLRNEPNYAWGNALSGLLLTPRLRGQWGVSTSENGTLYDHSGQGRAMAASGNPLASQNGIGPGFFVDASIPQYFYRATEPGIEISLSLSIWTWVRFHPESTGVQTNIFGKWSSAGNLRSYMLYKSTTDQMIFVISSNGTVTASASALASIYSEYRWFFMGGRFTPGAAVDLFVGDPNTGVLYSYTTATAIAALYDNGPDGIPLEAGRCTASPLDGAISLWGLAAYSCTDVDFFTKFHQIRPLFMW